MLINRETSDFIKDAFFDILYIPYEVISKILYCNILS